MIAGWWAVAALAQAYEVGAGDTISVQVFDEEMLSRVSVVSPRCAVDVELIGAVEVCGRTEGEIAAEIQQRLGEKYLVNPQVLVEVTTYGSQKVEVRGAVTTPGIQVLMGPTALSEVITRAGGPSGANVVDVEVVTPDGHSTTYSISSLTSMGDPVRVAAGDTVIVRQGRHVYVDGEVKTEGSVPYQEGLTVTQAISLAGGPGPYASKRRVRVLRASGQTVTVNLGKVKRGREPDFVLGPDDRVTLLHAVL